MPREGLDNREQYAVSSEMKSRNNDCSARNCWGLRSCTYFCQDAGTPFLICFLIGFIGLGIGSAILAIGIPEQKQTQGSRFQKVADEAFLRFESALDDYRVSGLWLRQACLDKDMTFERFTGVYQYITATGLEFLGVSCAMNVSASERAFFENQSRAYLSLRFPDYVYPGFMGVFTNETSGAREFRQLSNQSDYFITHFVEPLDEPYNLMSVDFDMSTSPYHSIIVNHALTMGNVSVTGRLDYLPPPDRPGEPYEYSVIMAHPGLSQAIAPAVNKSSDVAILVLRFNAFLDKAYKEFFTEEPTMIYIFDSTSSTDNRIPEFLGGAELGPIKLEYAHEVNDTRREKARYSAQKLVNFAGRQWIFVVVAPPDTYEPDYFLAIFGALMIVLASVCAALWIFSRSRARAEKSAILLESAKRAAQAERELNDFIAHEVRNPLSAAISANEFVSQAINESEPLVSSESKQSVREDVVVIGNSLQYINDLLRSMLDFHCALSNQINISNKHVSIRHDIFDPVASMLYHRGCDFDVLVDCPDELVVLSDPLRLKQVILNLAVNATKFVIRGFVRLRADVIQDVVYLYVEDSGPGIPLDKRDHLFQKFQPSLDSLNQGTGIGLSLCKHLVELMNGRIYLDESYTSDFESFPGCRFIISLKTPPIFLESSRYLDELSSEDDTKLSASGCAKAGDQALELSTSRRDFSLPENLSVLFVDDDFILRKLFIRSIRRCRPNWVVCEAASGEAALQLVEESEPLKPFDAIFLDQYMASAQKQLLGTETVRLLRSKGVKSLICGLSANEIGSQFLEAGADCFSMKPLPCDVDALLFELNRIWSSREKEARSSDENV